MAEKKKTSIGGQALLEGIMMRGPQRTAMAVRNPQGEIVLEEFPTQVSTRAKILKAPFVRGIFNMYDSLKQGYRCLMRSAQLAGLEEEEEKNEKSNKIVSAVIMPLAVVLAVVLAVRTVHVPAQLSVQAAFRRAAGAERPAGGPERVRGPVPHRHLRGLCLRYFAL